MRGGVTLLQVVVAVWAANRVPWVGAWFAEPLGDIPDAVYVLVYFVPGFVFLLGVALLFALLTSIGQWPSRQRGRGAFPVGISLGIFAVLFGVTMLHLPVNVDAIPVLNQNGLLEVAPHLFVVAFLLPFVWAYLLGLGSDARRERLAIPV